MEAAPLLYTNLLYIDVRYASESSSVWRLSEAPLKQWGQQIRPCIAECVKQVRLIVPGYIGCARTANLDVWLAVRLWTPLWVKTVVDGLLQHLKRLEVVEIQPNLSDMKDWTRPIKSLVLKCASIRKIKILDEYNQENNLL